MKFPHENYWFTIEKMRMKYTSWKSYTQCLYRAIMNKTMIEMEINNDSKVSIKDITKLIKKVYGQVVIEIKDSYDDSLQDGETLLQGNPICWIVVNNSRLDMSGNYYIPKDK